MLLGPLTLPLLVVVTVYTGGLSVVYFHVSQEGKQQLHPNRAKQAEINEWMRVLTLDGVSFGVGLPVHFGGSGLCVTVADGFEGTSGTGVDPSSQWPLMHVMT